MKRNNNGIIENLDRLFSAVTKFNADARQVSKDFQTEAKSDITELQADIVEAMMDEFNAL